jgi:hypothetical protein
VCLNGIKGLNKGKSCYKTTNRKAVLQLTFFDAKGIIHHEFVLENRL